MPNTNKRLSNLTPRESLPHRVRTLHRSAAAAAGLASLLMASLSQAASLTWDNGAANSLWDTSSLNWSGASWPGTSSGDDDAIFGATGVGLITLQPAGITANDLTFSTAGYTLTGGLLTLDGTSPSITNGVAATINADLAGTAGLTKIGNDRLTLGGTNTGLSGPLTIGGATSGNNGGVRVQSTASLGGLTSVDIQNNSFLELVSTTVGAAVPISVAGQGGTAAPEGAVKAISGVNVVEGPVTLANNTVRVGNLGTSLTFNGAITAPVGSGYGLLIRKANNDGVIFSNTTNYWEATTVLSDGRVYFQPGTLPTNTILQIAGSASAWFETSGSLTRPLGTATPGDVNMSANASGRVVGLSARGGDLTVDFGGAGADVVWANTPGFNPNILGLNSTKATGKLTLLNGLDLNGATRTIQVDAGLAELAGVVKNTGAAAAGLTKNATNGTLLLSQANTYNGTTTIAQNQGAVNALRISNSSALGTGSVTVGGGGNNDQARLELTGDITVNNTFASFSSRNNDKANILNLSGTNTLTASLSAGGGGTRTTLQSDAGKLILTGTLSTRQLNLLGEGDGELSGTVPLQGTYGLVKNGGGTWTLSGSATYAGATTVSGGTLALGAAGSISSPAINVASGATLDVSALAPFNVGAAGSQALGGNGRVLGNVSFGFGSLLQGNLVIDGSADMQFGSTNFPGDDLTAGTTTITNGLTLAGGSVLRYDLANVTTPGAGTNDLIAVGDALAINGSTTLELRFLNGALAAGEYTLFTYGSFSGDVANIVPPVSARYTFTVTNDTGAGAIKLLVSGISANLVWKGDGVGNYWDEGLSQNWLKDGTTLDYFYNGDVVVFNDLGSNTPAIYMANVVVPGSLLVDSTNDYEFTAFGGAGGIAGTTSLVKSNTGTLILTAPNSYSGGTLVAGGQLVAGTASADGGLGSGPVSNDTQVVLGGVNNVTLAAPIHGIGSLVKSNLNRVTLSGLNTYAGGTRVTEGTLVLPISTLASWPAASALTVDAGATFDIGNNPISITTLLGAGSVVNGGGNERTIEVGAHDAASEFYGSIRGRSPLQLWLRINKQGTNTLVLGGDADNFNLGLLVNGGTVILNKTNASARAVGSTWSSTQVNPIQVNTGILQLGTNSAGDQILDGASVVVNSGGTFDVQGQSETFTDLTINSGGTLLGPGALNASVSVASGGTLDLGPALAAMAVSNSLSLAGTTRVKVNKTAGTHDVWVGMTSVSYGGDLVVSNLSGTLAAGDSFPVFQPDVPGTGAFASITPAPGAGLDWSFDAATGVLTVVGGLPSTPTNLTFTVSNGVLELTWPGAYQGWIAQSNSVNLAVEANWFDIAGSESVTNLPITLNPAEPNVFYRLRYPTPAP